MVRSQLDGKLQITAETPTFWIETRLASERPAPKVAVLSVLARSELPGQITNALIHLVGGRGVTGDLAIEVGDGSGSHHVVVV